MATTSHTYFDHYQAPADEELSKGKEYECIGDHLPLETVYSYNPTSVAENPVQEKNPRYPGAALVGVYEGYEEGRIHGLPSRCRSR
jgi:histidinol phosphatase-like PHP family hydrolase